MKKVKWILSNTTPDEKTGDVYSYFAISGDDNFPTRAICFKKTEIVESALRLNLLLDYYPAQDSVVWIDKTGEREGLATAPAKSWILENHVATWFYGVLEEACDEKVEQMLTKGLLRLKPFTDYQGNLLVKLWGKDDKYSELVDAITDLLHILKAQGQ